jgi:hypothetical protein
MAFVVIFLHNKVDKRTKGVSFSQKNVFDILYIIFNVLLAF